MWHDVGTALVLIRQQEIAREVESLRLAKSVPPRHHTTVREQLAHLTHWLRAGQLGQGYVNTQTGPLTARCATC